MKLGYFGIKCRSQLQINQNLSIADAIKEEQLYFSRHPAYATMSNQMGIPFLCRSLNKILVSHI